MPLRLHARQKAHSSRSSGIASISGCSNAGVLGFLATLLIVIAAIAGLAHLIKDPHLPSSGDHGAAKEARATVSPLRPRPAPRGYDLEPSADLGPGRKQTGVEAKVAASLRHTKLVPVITPQFSPRSVEPGGRAQPAVAQPKPSASSTAAAVRLPFEQAELAAKRHVWSIRKGVAFVVNASAIESPPVVPKSPHSCANSDWGYDQVLAWGQDEGTVHCRGSSDIGAILRKHCTVFPLQGGKRCFQTVEFKGAHAVPLKKTSNIGGGTSPVKPRWLLPCDIVQGGSLNTAGDALNKVFQNVPGSGVRGKQLLEQGVAVRADHQAFMNEVHKQAGSLVDWASEGPPPQVGPGGGTLPVKDLEAAAGSLSLSWPTASAADRGFVYYFANRDCGPPRWNAFHCSADIWNAVQVLAALKLSPKEVVVVFTDSQVHSPYEHLWRTVGGAGVYTAQRLGAIPASIRPPMRRAIISPSGDSSVMWQENHSFTKCRHAVGSYRLFKEHVLRGLALWPQTTNLVMAATELLLISRQPKSGVQMGRRMGNEPAVMQAMERGLLRAREQGKAWLPADMKVVKLDFAEAGVRDQVAAALRARVIIGVHGAGMTWQMFQMPLPGAGLIEIHPDFDPKNPGMMSKCFANQAVLTGVNYMRWFATPQESKFNGDTNVDVRSIEGLVATLLTQDPSRGLGPREGGPGVLGLVRTGDPTEIGAMPGLQA